MRISRLLGPTRAYLNKMRTLNHPSTWVMRTGARNPDNAKGTSRGGDHPLYPYYNHPHSRWVDVYASVWSERSTCLTVPKEPELFAPIPPAKCSVNKSQLWVRGTRLAFMAQYSLPHRSGLIQTTLQDLLRDHTGEVSRKEPKQRPIGSVISFAWAWKGSA